MKTSGDASATVCKCKYSEDTNCVRVWSQDKASNVLDAR
jgi:hypothetical protein